MNPWTNELRWCLDLLWDAEREKSRNRCYIRDIARWGFVTKVSLTLKETCLRLRNNLTCLVCQIIDFFPPACWSVNEKRPPITVPKIVTSSGPSVKFLEL